MQYENIQSAASAAVAGFETRTRSDGSEYVARRKGSPEWLEDLCREAHAGMLPDDLRYAMIEDACRKIVDASDPGDDLDDLAHEFADEVDVYSGDLAAWLSSHGLRAGYVDEARAEGLIGVNATLDQQFMAGQYAERYEVFTLVRDGLEALV